MPFEILGAVVLPDHLHFFWQLSLDDDNYSKRVGKIKVTFTKLFQQQNSSTEKISLSRQKHRESNIWQRRFWEHTIKDEFDFAQHLDYIHYNPIKHNLVSCPHLWKYSSFDMWVKNNIYLADWCCVCDGKKPNIPSFEKILNQLGE